VLALVQLEQNGSIGNDTDPTIGILGNLYVTIDAQIGIGSITVGMAATHLALPGQQIGIQTGTKVVGIDRATQQIYLDKALEANIQVATGSTVQFSYTEIQTFDRTSGLSNCTWTTTRRCTLHWYKRCCCIWYYYWYLYSSYRTNNDQVYNHSCNVWSWYLHVVPFSILC